MVNVGEETISVPQPWRRFCPGDVTTWPGPSETPHLGKESFGREQPGARYLTREIYPAFSLVELLQYWALIGRVVQSVEIFSWSC